MATGIYKITEEFEKALCNYTGAKYAVTVDNQSNALFLALKYENIEGKTISIPKHTYPSVPCEIIHAGGKVKFEKFANCNEKKGTLRGAYPLFPTKVWDSALRFTSNMYIPSTYMCISFTGSRKIFKLLSKGGAILTDDYEAYKWFKKARFSGRNECQYHEDDFDKNGVIGWNFYLNPELSLRGLMLMDNFYDLEGNPKHNEDLELPYPNLSKFKIYTK